LTNKICAIRETFEESGLLLSNPPSHLVKDLDINEWRLKVHDDATQFKEMCTRFNIRPAIQDLIPFSNWITPKIEKKRYDTLFFLTVLNQYKTQKEHDTYYHLVAADGKETVLFEWLKPEEALQLQKDKKILTIPPQWYSLNLLSQLPHYKDLIEKAGFGSFKSKDGRVIAILPLAQPTEEDSPQAKEGYSVFLAYPGDEKYTLSDQYTSRKGDRHRLYFKGRMEDFKLERNVDVSTIIINKDSHL
jgi:8-oxo-dGTP pyrophosphatase MutT (NUDIX family)